MSGRERRCEWSFDDRGLGPKLTERIVLGDDGLPSSIENRGVDYTHTPVDERFTRGARRGFYVSEQGGAEEEAVLARALLAAPGHRLPLLPGGEAAIARVGALDQRQKMNSTMTPVSKATYGRTAPQLSQRQ